MAKTTEVQEFILAAQMPHLLAVFSLHSLSKQHSNWPKLVSALVLNLDQTGMKGWKLNRQGTFHYFHSHFHQASICPSIPISRLTVTPKHNAPSVSAYVTSAT